MSWIVEYTKKAEGHLKNLDGFQRKQVVKAIQKVAFNPLPNSEGGYGKPLGNHLTGDLTRYLKIKLPKAGLRVIYSIERKAGVMTIIVISIRSDDEVYKMVQERIYLE